MNREYHKWYSSRLGRDMELLVFGHAGLPVMVFPTSGGRFYEFEDRGMIGALAGKIDAGTGAGLLRGLRGHGELVQQAGAAALAHRKRKCNTTTT
jgi:esterase/lipase superfamily enzyme